MPADDFGDKTEQPTERRRADARQKGNVVRSADLTSAGHMLAAATAMLLLGLPTIQAIAKLTATLLGESVTISITRDSFHAEIREIAKQVAVGVLPFMLFLMAAALFLNLIQVGFLIAPDVLQPKLERLNPIAGAKRILSIQALVKLGVSLGKLILVVGIAAWSITTMLPSFLPMMGAEPSVILAKMHDAVVQLAFQLALALIVLSLLDYAFQKWKHEKDLRMTKQEVREEMKNMEGDPHIRQRRREAHRQLAEARELQQVRTADVVITNPTHIAVALKYDPEEMPAPTVVAKGMDERALRIRQIAAEHGIPIIERKSLARALNQDVKTGQQIPVEMYEVFVEIMAYVYRLSGRTPPNVT